VHVDGGRPAGYPNPSAGLILRFTMDQRDAPCAWFWTDSLDDFDGQISAESCLGDECPVVASEGSIMWLRSVQSLLVGVAQSAIGLAAWISIHRRSEHLMLLAAYHLQAHEVLLDSAGGPLECLQVGDGETWESAGEKRFAARGGRELLAYKASTYHWDLFEKYRKAAASPWSPVEADPQPPRMANSRLDADTSYVQMVRDWDKPLPGGMQ